MNYKQQMAVILMNVAMVAELCVSIYLSNADPDNFTPLFLKYFFSMVVPTLIAARVAVKRLRTGDDGSAEYSAS